MIEIYSTIEILLKTLCLITLFYNKKTVDFTIKIIIIFTLLSQSIDTLTIEIKNYRLIRKELSVCLIKIIKNNIRTR